MTTIKKNKETAKFFDSLPIEERVCSTCWTINTTRELCGYISSTCKIDVASNDTTRIYFEKIRLLTLRNVKKLLGFGVGGLCSRERIGK
jgi:hypothetical protein